MGHRTLMAAAPPLLLTPLASAHDDFAALATGDRVVPPVVTTNVGYASFELHADPGGPELE